MLSRSTSSAATAQEHLEGLPLLMTPSCSPLQECPGECRNRCQMHACTSPLYEQKRPPMLASYRMTLICTTAISVLRVEV